MYVISRPHIDLTSSSPLSPIPRPLPYITANMGGEKQTNSMQ